MERQDSPGKKIQRLIPALVADRPWICGTGFGVIFMSQMKGLPSNLTLNGNQKSDSGSATDTETNVDPR